MRCLVAVGSLSLLCGYTLGWGISDFWGASFDRNAPYLIERWRKGRHTETCDEKEFGREFATIVKIATGVVQCNGQGTNESGFHREKERADGGQWEIETKTETEMEIEMEKDDT
jgi:hypothetical protein